MTLDPQRLYPRLADWLAENGAGHCFVSAQEQQESAPGDWPHGTVSDCGGEETGYFQTIWNDQLGAWLNTYATVVIDEDDGQVRLMTAVTR